MSEATDSLLASFRDAAIRKGEILLPAKIDHQLHREMAMAFWALQDLGEPGMKAFRSLLHDESPEVRGWAAAELLSEGDTGAVDVLEALEAADGWVGFSAKWTLTEYRGGKLGSPFGERDA